MGQTCKLQILHARLLTSRVHVAAGTLTVGDIQVVTVAALDGLAVGTSLGQNLSHKYDLKARSHALHVVRAWAAKGYQPIYLSGRQVSQLCETIRPYCWS